MCIRDRYLTGTPARGQQAGWASSVPLTTWGTTGLMQTTTGATGTDRLLLPIWPVSAITSVHDDAEWEWGEDTEVSSDDYILFRDVWALRKKPSADLWSTAERAIQIVLTAGYEEIPDDMRLAAGLQLKHLWNNRALVGQTADAVDGASVGVRPFTLLPAVRELLAPFCLTRGQGG